jgi:hypothetical protein
MTTVGASVWSFEATKIDRFYEIARIELFSTATLYRPFLAILPDGIHFDTDQVRIS